MASKKNSTKNGKKSSVPPGVPSSTPDPEPTPPGKPPIKAVAAEFDYSEVDNGFDIEIEDDALLDQMQEPSAHAAMQAAFDASPAELGEAAVHAAAEAPTAPTAAAPIKVIVPPLELPATAPAAPVADEIPKNAEGVPLYSPSAWARKKAREAR